MKPTFEHLNIPLFQEERISEAQSAEIKGGSDYCSSSKNTYVYQNGDHIAITDDGRLKGIAQEGWL